MSRDEEIRIQIDTARWFEKGVKGEGLPTDVYPDWVYAARQALKHADGSIPWLNDLLAALEWKSGTIHQALSAVRRLVAVEKEREKK